MLVGYLLILIIVLWIIYQRWRNREIYELAKNVKSGVRTLPFLGHSYLFWGPIARMKAWQILGRDAIKKENGMTVVWHGDFVFTMIAEPEAAEFVLKTFLEKHDIMKLITTFIGNGSIFAPVSIWKPRRKVLMPTFSTKNMKQLLSIFNKQSKVLFEQMDKEAGTGILSAWKYYTAYTMDSIAESVLDHEFHSQQHSTHPFLKTFDMGLNYVTKRILSPWLHSNLVYNNLPVHKKMLEMRDYLWNFIKELIETKRNKMKENEMNKKLSKKDESEERPKSFLELLITLSGGDDGYTDLEIVEELMVLLIAGNDTSAVGLCFVSSMLSRHSDVQQKVYEELQEVFGDSDRPMTWEDLPRLKYLDAVIRESLRLYTPVPVITRKVDKVVTLPSGIKLVPGTGILLNIWALHRNPRYWGEDAEQFRPERFIDTPLKHPAAFMAFSNGPRNCVGYQFAMISMKTVIASVVRHFKILPAIKPVNSVYPPLRLTYDIMMKDVDECQIILERRVEK